MNKIKYESPNFEFNDMKLTEAIAERCWGYGYAFIDHDRNDSTPLKQYFWPHGDKGCKGNQDQDRITAIENDPLFDALDGLITTDMVDVNTKSSEWIKGPEDVIPPTPSVPGLS